MAIFFVYKYKDKILYPLIAKATTQQTLPTLPTQPIRPQPVRPAEPIQTIQPSPPIQPTQPTTTVKFPVTPSSNPNDIMEAFIRSGYWSALEASVRAGIYPTSYLDSARKDPRGWLVTHPYLYSAYPEYFRPS